jgi:hypothetical protein
MSYMTAFSRCFGCGQPFSYNPALVPSIRDPKTGLREPVCQICVDRVNPERERRGLEPIRPLPGAYDAAEEIL